MVSIESFTLVPIEPFVLEFGLLKLFAARVSLFGFSIETDFGSTPIFQGLGFTATTGSSIRRCTLAELPSDSARDNCMHSVVVNYRWFSIKIKLSKSNSNPKQGANIWSFEPDIAICEFAFVSDSFR